MSDTPVDHTLELSRDEMQKLGYQVVDLLVEHWTTLRSQSVSAGASRHVLEQRLREPLPEAPTAPDMVLQQLQQDVFGNILQLQHPRFFAFVPSPSNFVSVLADALVAGFNIFAGTWMAASGPEEIELITIDWLRDLCGLPQSTRGLFVSGGSMANLTGLAVARHVRLDNRLADAVAYCSDQTHTATDRAFRVLGFDASQLRKLPSDGALCLSVPALREAIAADRAAGKRPFCVIANAGTTSSGAVDPLGELADLCRDEQLWLHVDAAYGGAAVLCEQGRAVLAGIERADSLVLDPHKWLFQPIECGCLLVRDGDALRDTFRVRADYLQDVDRTFEEINFCDYGIQLTRSFRALKLWMSLKVFGLAAFRAAVAHGMELAAYAEAQLRQLPGWEVVTPAQLGILTFRYVQPGATAAQIDNLNDRLVGAMFADGFALLSSTRIHNRTALRLCPINPRTTEQDVQETLHWLDDLTRKLLAAEGVTGSPASSHTH